jgi:6-phosphogluconate dehydrogenase
MHIGLIGLGRMGLNMGRRWLRSAHTVVAYNRSSEKTEQLAAEGAIAVLSLEALVQAVPTPRCIWIMLPAGGLIDEQIEQLTPLLAKGDLIIDGANGFFRDAIRRAAHLREQGLSFLDAGVSGGIWGLENGYCTMVGGAAADFERIEPLLHDLAPPDGYLHAGPAGAGHFLKMVHNCIEYALMQAYGEGFELLQASPFGYDLSAVASLWNQGSVVRSWLLELLESALKRDPTLASLSAYVDDSGEGRWTVQQAVELGVPAPAISTALFARFASRDQNALSLRVLAALRREFGGHAVKPAEVPASSRAR